MDIGFTTPSRPIAPIPEQTEIFPAGQLSFGLEFRLLNNEMVDAHLATQTGGAVRPRDLDTSGLSIHVNGKDGHEYLRFDCFEDGPHYHYVYRHQEFQRIVHLDTLALGDPLDWAIGCLRNRLAPMMAEAGGAASLEGADPAQIAAAIGRVERAIADFRTHGRRPSAAA